MSLKPAPVFYTTAEVSGQLKLAPSTVAAYARAGEFPGAFKIGIDWRFPSEAISAFVAAHTPTKTDPHQIAPRSRRAQRMNRKTA